MKMQDATIFRVKPPLLAEWLTGPIRANRHLYMQVALAAVLINIFGLATSLFSMTVYDRVVPNNAIASLIALSIGIAVVLVFDFILRMLRAYFVDVAGARIDQRIGDAMFQKLLAYRLDMRRGSSGAMAGLLREFESLRDFFASATLTAIVDVPFILLFLIVIFAIGGVVVLVPLLMIPLVILVGLLTQPALERLAAKVMNDGLSKQGVLVETIGGLEMVKAVRAGGLLRRRWQKALIHHADSALRQRLISTIGISTAGLAQNLAYAGTVIVGVNLIASGDLSMGGLIACSILAGRAVTPLSQIASLLSRLTTTRAAYDQLDQLMQSPDERPVGEPIRRAGFAGAIEFRGVSFRYPDSESQALDDVSFTIAPGERVALLGRVGSGKSTVGRLLLGLYHPDDGAVLIDGTDIRQMVVEDVRDAVGVMLQDNVLLSGTVRDNIALGRAGVDDDELIRVATVSGTHDFMGQLANGYDLSLADRGEGLSGGQRQSIGIARALVGKPAIFLFDEPSSAMDAETEAALVERLSKEIGDRTLILITHRPSLLTLTDRIILLEQGKKVADGPRDEVAERLQAGHAHG